MTAAPATYRPSGDGISGHYASAGHPPAHIRRANGTVEPLDAAGILLSPSMRLGREHLKETMFHLNPGDALLLYTDGITEAPRAIVDSFRDVGD
ncbi:SpoIIE family protein phosphatase [Micromonospora sp. NPDC001898]|uniref:SpoIIE family protein phosphatase n=1 Tax=Micromonospora sp. NPDC001898 TaxID=3364221 RepID=UPI0036BAFA11